jgi:ribosomal protein S14
MKTIKCPQCGQQHGLFFYRTDEKHSQLSYRCDKAGETQGVDKYGFSRIVSRTMILDVPKGTVADKDVPEVLAPAYRKRIEGKGQLQFTNLLWK